MNITVARMLEENVYLKFPISKEIKRGFVKIIVINDVKIIN